MTATTTVRPLVVAAVVAVASLGLVVAAAADGWLGPDIGRGSGFCEAASAGWIKQPVNTWSNLAFVVAGLFVAGYAARPLRLGLTMGAHPGLAVAYAVLVVVLGPASMAMHATQTRLGGAIDQMSMFLLAGFAASYGVMRLFRLGPWSLAVGFPVAFGWAEGVRRGAWPVWDTDLVNNRGNAAFGVLLAVTLLSEAAVALVQRPRVRQDLWWGLAAVAVFAGSFGVWHLGRRGSAWCDPHSLLQWHGVWHVGCAAAAYLLFRHYAAERARP